MNKDEIRHDPVKEKIVSLIEYVIDKKNIFFYSILILVAVIASSSFYFNSLSNSNKDGWSQNQEAMTEFFRSLSSENMFNASITDSLNLQLAIDSFNDIISNHSGTSSADFALLKSIRGEILLNNFSKVKELLMSNDLSSSNSYLNFQFNRLKGDVLYDKGMPLKALEYYDRSISFSPSDDLSVPINIKKIYVLLNMGEYQKANKIIKSIDLSDLAFSEKNSLLEFEYFIKNKVK